VKRALAALTAIAVLSVLNGCTIATGPKTPELLLLSPKSPPAVVFAPVGDSITAGYDGVAGWPDYASREKRLQAAGGWFRVGLRTDQMVAGALERGVPAADVLVLMGCTNDIIAGHPIDECLANWDVLAAEFRMPVIVAAIAPSNTFPAETLAYNAALERHAAEHGWGFIDPWREIRAPDGTYLPGMMLRPDTDPFHPNDVAACLAGARMAEGIYDWVRGHPGPVVIPNASPIQDPEAAIARCRLMGRADGT
jgi:hypothetical protein